MSTSFYVKEEKKFRKFRTDLPNIIFTLGLDPYQFAVYSLVKKIAGDYGKCYANREVLAKQLGISIRKLAYVKKSLASPFKELDGLPLIRVVRNFSKNGARLSDQIEIVNIWHLNNKKNLDNSADNLDGAGGADSPEGGAHENTNSSKSGAHEPSNSNKSGVHECTKSNKNDVHGARPTAPSAHKEETKFKKKETSSKDEAKKNGKPFSLAHPSSKSTGTPKKRNEFVKTSDEEHKKLLERFGPEKTMACYQRLADWKQDTSRSRWKKSDYRSILRWVCYAVDEDRKRKATVFEEDTRQESVLQNRNWAAFLNNLNFSEERYMVRSEFAVRYVNGNERFSIGYAEPNFKQIVGTKLRNWGYNLRY